MSFVNCQHCAALVELLMVELDGSLHTCPEHILARVRRSVVDERWWEQKQAPSEVPEEPAVPQPRQQAQRTTAQRFLDIE
jgi:hypothetical protein